VLLLLEHERRPVGGRRRNGHDGRNVVTFARSDLQRDQSALAVADERDPLLVHVFALLQPFDDRPRILGVVGERDALRSTAALADTALVVADDEESRGDEIAGQLPEDRESGGGFVGGGR